MAAERPNRARPPKKVAGRTGSRVELSADAAKRREQALADAATRTEGSVTAESGVERKRRRAEATQAAKAAEQAVAQSDSGVNDTAGTYRLAAIVGAIAAVLAVVAVVLALHPGADTSDNEAFVDQAATDEVLGQARSVVCTPFQFDSRKMDDWQGQIENRLTGDALTEAQTFLKASREAITQTQSASDCRVEELGLTELDGDRATALGVLAISTARGGAIDESSQPHIEFFLVRQDGQWKLSNLQAF